MGKSQKAPDDVGPPLLDSHDAVLRREMNFMCAQRIETRRVSSLRTVRAKGGSDPRSAEGGGVAFWAAQAAQSRGRSHLLPDPSDDSALLPNRFVAKGLGSEVA